MLAEVTWLSLCHMAKMALWPAVQAFLACGWCLLGGFVVKGVQGTQFSGYAEPAEQVWLGLGPCKVGDAKLQV